MHDVHGVAALPDDDAPAGPGSAPANRRRAGVLRRLRARATTCPVVRPVRVDRVTDEDGLLVRARRRADLDHADPGQRHRHLVAAVRAALPRRRDVRRRPGAHPRLPRRRLLPRTAHPRRRRRRVGRAAARRDRAGDRHAVGDPAPAGVAHRRLHARGGARRGRPRRGPGTARPAAGQRRQRHRVWPCASRSGPPRRSAPTNGGRCSPRSSATACAGPTAPSRRSTRSCGPPASVRPSPTWRRCGCADRPAASGSTAPPRWPTRGSSSSATARRPAPSAPTAPAASAARGVAEHLAAAPGARDRSSA